MPKSVRNPPMRSVVGHAKVARKNLEARLRAAGCTLSLEDAIDAGKLTERDWCEELDLQREMFGLADYSNREPNPSAIRLERMQRERNARLGRFFV